MYEFELCMLDAIYSTINYYYYGYNNSMGSLEFHYNSYHTDRQLVTALLLCVYPESSNSAMTQTLLPGPLEKKLLVPQVYLFTFYLFILNTCSYSYFAITFIPCIPVIYFM